MQQSTTATGELLHDSLLALKYIIVILTIDGQISLI